MEFRHFGHNGASAVYDSISTVKEVKRNVVISEEERALERDLVVERVLSGTVRTVHLSFRTHFNKMNKSEGTKLSSTLTLHLLSVFQRNFQVRLHFFLL